MAHSTTTNLGVQDFFTTTLTQSVALNDTVINLANVPTPTEGYLVIDPNNVTTREIVYYTTTGSGTVTTPDHTQGSGRGVGGTTAQTHNSGILVEMRSVAEYWTALQNGESLAAGAVATSNLATGIEPTTVATNPYKFRVSMNGVASTGNAAFLTVPFDTEQYDTGSNISAGVFTAPANGFYQFNWTVTAVLSTGANEQYVASLFIGSTRTSDGNTVTNENTWGSHGSDIVQLSSGNTVTIRTYDSGTARSIDVGNIYNTYFSGFLVSAT